MLHYQQQGSGPDVVLVHGFLGSGKIFEPLTTHLSRTFTVTTIDLPGFGNSVNAPVPPTVQDLSQIVAETVRSAGIQACSMLGHSLGAWIALELSIEQPELLNKAVLYGGSPDGYCPERFETYEDSVKQIQAVGIESFAADLAAVWFRRGKQDPMYPLAEEAGRGASQDAAIAHVRSWDSWVTRDRIGSVTVPTLIACGDRDRSTHPDLSIEMWKSIVNSQLLILPNAGHIAHLEQIEVFNLAVENFLSNN